GHTGDAHVVCRDVYVAGIPRALTAEAAIIPRMPTSTVLVVIAMFPAFPGLPSRRSTRICPPFWTTIQSATTWIFPAVPEAPGPAVLDTRLLGDPLARFTPETKRL